MLTTTNFRSDNIHFDWLTAIPPPSHLEIVPYKLPAQDTIEKTSWAAQLLHRIGDFVSSVWRIREPAWVPPQQSPWLSDKLERLLQGHQTLSPLEILFYEETIPKFLSRSGLKHLHQKLALVLHSDKVQGEDKKLCEKAFQIVQEAYQKLDDLWEKNFKSQEEVPAAKFQESDILKIRRIVFSSSGRPQSVDCKQYVQANETYLERERNGNLSGYDLTCWNRVKWALGAINLCSADLPPKLSADMQLFRNTPFSLDPSYEATLLKVRTTIQTCKYSPFFALEWALAMHYQKRGNYLKAEQFMRQTIRACPVGLAEVRKTFQEQLREILTDQGFQVSLSAMDDYALAKVSKRIARNVRECLNNELRRLLKSELFQESTNPGIVLVRLKFLNLVKSLEENPVGGAVEQCDAFIQVFEELRAVDRLISQECALSRCKQEMVLRAIVGALIGVLAAFLLVFLLPSYPFVKACILLPLLGLCFCGMDSTYEKFKNSKFQGEISSYLTREGLAVFYLLHARKDVESSYYETACNQISSACRNIGRWPKSCMLSQENLHFVLGRICFLRGMFLEALKEIQEVDSLSNQELRELLRLINDSIDFPELLEDEDLGGFPFRLNHRIMNAAGYISQNKGEDAFVLPPVQMTLRV